MAIMKNIILGACALISVAQAAPVMLTVTDIVTQTYWETIDCTSTIWRPINEPPASTTEPLVISTSTSTPAPAPVSSNTTTSTYVAPVQTTPLVVSTATTIVVTPTLSSTTITTPAPVVAAVTTTVSPSSVPAQASPTPIARAGTFVEASADATCEGEGAACVGDVTHWDGGLGACGWSVDTANDLSIALPVGFMGAQSNGNPYCGRTVTLLDPTTGITMQATVGDKCMGCVDRAIDCTDKLFTAITGGTGDGRVSGIEWWFS